MTGRPSIYSAEIAALICQRIADGESLRAICADEAMPGQTTVFRWLAADQDFREQYARAREAQVELYAEDIIEISDDASRDTIVTDHGEKAVSEWIARSKLRVDTRKWLMSKLAPKKYGDRVSAELTGANGGPIQTESVSDIEIARRIAFALTRGEKSPRKP